jgi:hypothetical protein
LDWLGISYDYAVGYVIDPANGDVIVGASLSFPLATSSTSGRGDYDK